jgi:hypothetical protein
MTVRNLARYNGRQFLGTIKIIERGRHKLPTITAKDFRGKRPGAFQTQKAAVAAIDRAGPAAVAQRHPAL